MVVRLDSRTVHRRDSSRLFTANCRLLTVTELTLKLLSFHGQYQVTTVRKATVTITVWTHVRYVSILLLRLYIHTRIKLNPTEFYRNSRRTGLYLRDFNVFSKWLPEITYFLICFVCFVWTVDSLFYHMRRGRSPPPTPAQRGRWALTTVNVRLGTVAAPRYYEVWQ